MIQATYAHYAGKYSEAQFANNTNVANPSLTSATATPARPARAWSFAPGFDPANYSGDPRRHVPDGERAASRTACTRR